MLSIFSYHLVVLLTDAYFSYMQLILVSKNVNITLYVLCEDIFLSKISKYFPPPHVGWHLFYLICGQSWLLLSTRLPNNSTTWQSFLATIIFTNNHTIQMSENFFWGRESHRDGKTGWKKITVFFSKK